MTTQHQSSILPTDESTDETIGRLRRSIRELPTDSQMILSMKYLDRMSIHEIAEALQIPTGTVKSRLFHAREQLKQIKERNIDE